MFSLYPFCRFLSSFGKTLFSPLFPTPKNEKAKAPLWHGAFLSDFRLNAPLGLPLGLKEKQHADGNAQGIKPGRNAQDQPRRTDYGTQALKEGVGDYKEASASYRLNPEVAAAAQEGGAAVRLVSGMPWESLGSLKASR